MDQKQLNKALKRMKYLAFFMFLLAPVLAWGSMLLSDETAVFASLSRMIWYSGSAALISAAMLVLFVPMIVSFFLAHNLSGISKTQRRICRISMIASCVILYLGAMEFMPSDGMTMTIENIWHGILSFGGMFLIFLTYGLYTAFVRRKDKDGAFLLAWMLVFVLVTSAFAVSEVFDENSYVIASAISELYVLAMLGLMGYLTYYLAYRQAKDDCMPQTVPGAQEEDTSVYYPAD